MNEEISQKKTDEVCTNCTELQVFQITKPLIYSLRTNISKSLKYCIETKTENKKRIQREETIRNKKTWLDRYKEDLGSYSSICTKTGISRSTFNYWKKDDDEFREQIFSIKDDRVDNIEDKLVSEAMNGNVSALKFLLEHNHPKYSKKLQVETFTGDRTLEDLLDEDEEKLNKENDGEKKEEKPVGVIAGAIEDQKQEGEDSPLSA